MQTSALIATAPSSASMPGGSSGALLFSAIFAALWLVSAAFFRIAAKSDQTAATAH